MSSLQYRFHKSFRNDETADGDYHQLLVFSKSTRDDILNDAPANIEAWRQSAFRLTRHLGRQESRDGPKSRDIPIWYLNGRDAPLLCSSLPRN
ncbi:hypothetical protein AVEN_173032-1 [Araneus ventricosus]|uniref:Uncharacterized protein n=1 Tax=Araneus ventricosus TaxID=182803 RepID=A0A4Y2LS33_ARAVE|nr:hypothetical protein AVEN_173032-1 [Araneus ventricosus]